MGLISYALTGTGSYESNVPKLGRGIGLILQVSSGNYSLRCKGHPEYHRARAIATLQFNCHLALMVVVLVGFYSIVCGRKIGNSVVSDSTGNLRYTPLGAEMHSLENLDGNFTLDSDDEEIKDGNVGSQKVMNGINGN
ncbi:hypothetical protein L195_g026374 [Trifolium pratense]|uniref:Uncharacterized protein n=1 Tax=Trifolium pratense TaxID=57577 RepID=A0A2K3NJ49_TRIPR|nr:hypothetical protein L195_g026374 [Trifolium pratense]